MPATVVKPSSWAIGPEASGGALVGSTTNPTWDADTPASSGLPAPSSIGGISGRNRAMLNLLFSEANITLTDYNPRDTYANIMSGLSPAGAAETIPADTGFTTLSHMTFSGAPDLNEATTAANAGTVTNYVPNLGGATAATESMRAEGVAPTAETGFPWDARQGGLAGDDLQNPSHQVVAANRASGAYADGAGGWFSPKLGAWSAEPATQ